MDTKKQHLGFYRAFEDRFRGSRNEIRTRLEAYSPFLEAILPYSAKKLALDLGCGRGEWLELLRDKGFAPLGVDLDERMLAASRELDLNVQRMDAIEAISSAESSSLLVVSGFHIAEHLPFDKLQVMISEALRALVPGGLLILETPNPENIKVASHTFHLDPTHQNPLPPALLQFMTDYYGFSRSKIVRLQENPKILQSPMTSIGDIIFGVSPDYAIVAQKYIESQASINADTVFSKSFGISDYELMDRFESSSEKLIQNVITELDNVKDALKKQEQTLSAMHNSFSWKITAPLRSIDRGIRWLVRGLVAWTGLQPGSRTRRAMRYLLTCSILWLRNYPRLAHFLLKISRISPALERRLILSAQARGIGLSLRPMGAAGVKAWNIDIEPEVVRKWEELS